VLLALKLTVTPLAIALLTLATRRWGATRGAWLAAIPYTSAPVVAFLAADRGTRFAATTAVGVLAGTASQAAFALAYAWVAVRLRWLAAPAAGGIAFVIATAGLNTLNLTVLPALAIVTGAVVLALTLLPPREIAAQPPRLRTLPAVWDVVLRGAIATAVVVVITAMAPAVGPALAGLISPMPLFGAIFIVFPHRLEGAGAAVEAARGFLWGLFACAGFFAVLAPLLEPAPLPVAYLAAAACAAVVQAITLGVLRRWPAAGAGATPAEDAHG